MKDKAKSIFLWILLVAFVCYLVGTGVYDLLNKKDLVTIQVDRAVEILEVEQSVNGLIPMGKDHYYLAGNSATGETIILRAAKSWYQKNFSEDGDLRSGDTLTVTSLAKRCDFDVARELENRVMQVEGISMVLSPDYCLALSFRFFAIAKILIVVLGIVGALMVYKIAKSDHEVGPAWRKTVLLLAILWLILMLIILYRQ
ncbi:MAG: hypothetical protein K6E18_02830 [Lachnospiraceae bacterium]|nr:hypothetical protein [Lachnospiraceae bacterium]